MKLSVLLLVILSIIALFVQSSQSKSIYVSKKKYIGKKYLYLNNNKKVINKKVNKGKKIEKKDQFYIIIVNNPYTNDTTINTKHKRDLNNIFIDGIVSDIHNLIVENKDTYNDPNKLQQLDDESAQMKKRSEILFDEENGESNYVYKISSIEEQTALYAYLSNDIANTVSTMTNIKACIPDDPNRIKFNAVDEDIKRETGWMNVLRLTNSYNHLSLISQGKFDDKLISKYDDSYYFPKSAGQGIYAFVIDLGFNFNSKNLQNTGRCWLYIKNAKRYTYSSGTRSCYSENEKGNGLNHGTKISHLISSVSPNVNIMGIVLDKGSLSNLFAAVETIQSYSTRSMKVINLSLSIELYKNLSNEDVDYFEKLIQTMQSRHIFVVASGNDGVPVNGKELVVPCAFKETICTGGIDNNISDLKTMRTQNYRISPESNYGKEVNLYAPYCTYINYLDYNNKSVSERSCGTSFSTALTTGVVSLILSQGKEMNVNSSNKGFNINNIGIPNIISNLPSGSNNLFLNNGKRIVYSKDNRYESTGCGPNVGNKRCPAGSCCSKYGYCGTSNDHCKVGCQSRFGTCK